ncbi:MAG: hypothetical protein ACI8PT_003241 [Gammaproteobacteria bacterium]
MAHVRPLEGEYLRIYRAKATEVDKGPRINNVWSTCQGKGHGAYDGAVAVYSRYFQVKEIVFAPWSFDKAWGGAVVAIAHGKKGVSGLRKEATAHHTRIINISARALAKREGILVRAVCHFAWNYAVLIAKSWSRRIGRVGITDPGEEWRK